MNNKLLTIIGMEAIVGSCQGLADFDRMIYTGDRHFIPIPPNRSLLESQEENISGGYLANFEIDAFYFKIPPLELDKIDPQELILVKVIDKALQDARLQFNKDKIKNIAIVTIAVELRSKKNIANKISKLWQINCQSYAENSIFSALVTAEKLLVDREVDLVVITAVNLLKQIQANLPQQGEGAAAVALQLYDRAKNEGDRIYAVIDAVSSTCEQAWQEAGVEPFDIEYLEVVGENEAVIAELVRVYERANSSYNCAMGSIASCIGRTGNLSGVLSLIKTALCFDRRYLPASNELAIESLLSHSPFYIPRESRPWFPATGKRIAAINILAEDGTDKHLIVSEDLTPKDRDRNDRSFSSFYLFPLAGNTQSDLEAQLDNLEAKLQDSDSLTQIANSTFASFSQYTHATYTLAIVAPDRDKLTRELEKARKGLKQALNTEKPWKSPLGSYFTPKPLGKESKIAFVYPGAFNSYLGMGRNLFYLFPKLYEYCATLSSNPGEFFREKQLYPRSFHPLSKRELETLDVRLMESPLAMLETGTGFAVLFTKIMRDYFGVQPQVAFGYSMGESTMMYALDVWPSTDTGSKFIHSSPLFHSRLAGEQKAVVEHWGLEIARSSKQLWGSYVLIAPAARVRECLERESRVYLTHINTPKEVTIAGDPQACLRVIEAVGCEYFPSPSNLVLHCKAMASEYNHFKQLNTVSIDLQPEIVFYSSASYAPIPFNTEAIAHHLSQGVCQELDFPKLIDRVYADGARIFVELGVGGTCSRWIDETLQEKDRVVTCISRRGVDDLAGIIKVLAQLVSHRVALDLSPLYLTDSLPAPKKSCLKTIALDKYPIKIKPANVIFDDREALELTQEKVSRLFGADFAIVDSYARRVRMPSPPFLFVSRVTKIEGERGNYKSGFIQTEYDIPEDAWFAVDGQIPVSICAEAGHGLLLLLSYLGADFESQGKRSFRLLDITTNFFAEQPENVRSLRYDVKITSHVKTTDSLLIFFTGECWIGEQLWLKLSGGCAGLFSDEELAVGQGIVISDSEKKAREKISKKSFQPLLTCAKNTFDRQDLLNLSKSNIAACFGEEYQQQGFNKSLRLSPEKLLTIDKIISVDSQGGIAGLGLVVASQTVTPNDWFFACHFQNDPTMPGNLMLEASIELLQFYCLYLGLQTLAQDACFQVIPDREQAIRFRGQVTPTNGTLFYQLEILEIGLYPRPFIIANVEIIFEDKVIAKIKNLSYQLVEKAEKSALFNSQQLQALANGSVIECLGEKFKVYGDRRCVTIPNREFCLIGRVLEVNSPDEKSLKDSTIVTEYDVAENAWFYRDNSYPYLPYCTYIEIAGQPCIFLGLYLGTTLKFSDEDLYFRNLDGQAKILKDIDVRGKTIVDRVTTISSTAIKGAILQKFVYELSCEGEIFYRGEMVFGYFSRQVLANQVGLDNGKIVKHWHEENQDDYSIKINLDLKDEIIRQKLYTSQSDRPYYHLANGKLDFLDRVLIIDRSGKYQKGYIYATKEITPEDWYFPYHFHRDPVMPGALGVETILQAMQVYALQLNLGKQFKSPRFAQALNHQITWKYRGQITPENKLMSLEIHIKDIETEPDIIKIIGDASLWKENLRIYEITDIAICLLEAEEI
jgi:PfaB family protein